jgi:hypothetical protein
MLLISFMGICTSNPSNFIVPITKPTRLITVETIEKPVEKPVEESVETPIDQQYICSPQIQHLNQSSIKLQITDLPQLVPIIPLSPQRSLNDMPKIKFYRPLFEMSLDNVKTCMIQITFQCIKFKFNLIDQIKEEEYFEFYNKLNETDIDNIIRLYFSNLPKILIEVWKKYSLTKEWIVPQSLINIYSKHVHMSDKKYAEAKQQKAMKKAKNKRINKLELERKERQFIQNFHKPKTTNNIDSSSYEYPSYQFSLYDGVKSLETVESRAITSYLDVLSGGRYDPTIDGFKTAVVLESYHKAACLEQ